MNINEAYEKYLSALKRERVVTLQTLYTYRVTYSSYIRNTFGEKNPEDIKTLDVQKFLDEYLEDGFLSLDTIHLIETVFRKFYDYLISQPSFGIMDNPCIGMIIPKRESTIVRYLSFEDQEEVEQAIYAHGQRNIYGVFLSLYAGLRVAEIIALKWSDIDFDNCRIHVNRHISKYMDKDIKQQEVEIFYRDYDPLKRTIPISAAFRNVLKKIPHIKDVNYVFSTLGKRLTMRNFQTIVHKFLMDYCRVAYPISEFRNTYGARLLQFGVSPEKVAIVMGFTKTSTVFHNFGLIKSMGIKDTGMYRLP